jgi:hypothetical protein
MEDTAVNDAFIKRAQSLRGSIQLAFGMLLILDVAVLGLWLLFFLVMEDNSWYDWLEMMHVFMWLGYIITVVQSDNAYRNLKYVMIVGILVFTVDLILAAFVRPNALDDVNPLNTCKRNSKWVLLSVQIVFTVLDFVAIAVAVYYRYLSGLQIPEILARYQMIDAASRDYLTLAIKYFVTKDFAERIQSEVDALVREEAAAQSFSELVTKVASARQTVYKPQPPVPEPAPIPAPSPAPAQQQQQPTVSSRAQRSSYLSTLELKGF